MPDKANKHGNLYIYNSFFTSLNISFFPNLGQNFWNFVLGLAKDSKTTGHCKKIKSYGNVTMITNNQLQIE